MIASERYAAIDIGSNAVRLLLSEAFETDSGPYFRKISLIRMPVRLGSDAFIREKISKGNAKRLTQTIQGFKQLVKAYRPLDFQACATSAMREAANGNKIRKRIRAKTGVDIRIISGKEEARTIFANNPWGHLPEGGAWLFVDVGGGSTEITIFANGKTVSHSFGIGTIRLLENLVSPSQWKAMKRWIRDHTRDFTSIDAVGSGGNINKLIKLAKCTDGRSITLGKMKKVRGYLKFFSYEDRITKLGLKPDRADVIMPALKIYISVMKWGGIHTLSVPQVGLADGLVRLMYRKRNQPPGG
ncbi:exopolyphosphatase [Desulfosarcina ovata]|uniref:Exopolyphosphatase n=1 Tax=Desulfosarcina ovata subsp. ovata TaxID=2752305 RepID=A0A5K8AJZ2_9BACT|nr:exopolyphosphatase [Desulfosarcina ovata]BBO93037.1 exopolyphosphatase [Desulfosarcina ovata subsp. ovata]